MPINIKSNFRMIEKNLKNIDTRKETENTKRIII